MRHTLPLVPKVLALLPTLRPRQVVTSLADNYSPDFFPIKTFSHPAFANYCLAGGLVERLSDKRLRSITSNSLEL